MAPPLRLHRQESGPDVPRDRTILIFGALLTVATLIAGCRVEEQGRPLIVHKGEYAGAPDTPLTASQLQVLDRRAELQGAADTTSGSPVPAESGAASHPAPAPAPQPQLDSTRLPEQKLENRMRMQSGQ
jgi:hypothetical protein